ncbi:MAG: hypothetical protein AB7F79_07015 [Steroidobacteraceae bacterium]
MSEKPEDDFDEDADLVGADSDDSKYESLIEDIGRSKRGTVSQEEPAWRRLEKYREQKFTAEQVSDFDDYDIGEREQHGGKRRRKQWLE